VNLESGAHPSEFELGVLVGVLVGEGHFGGDGRRPHVTLRMHVDHHGIFDWLAETFPDSRVYGPYEHAGRRYYQWMARGRFLREVLVPILDVYLQPRFSRRVYDRYQAMKDRYQLPTIPGVPPALRATGTDPTDPSLALGDNGSPEPDSSGR
jgi:hypothetical protein